MRVLMVVVLLVACAAPVTPDARYVGVTTPATSGEFCKPGRAVLRLRDGRAVFTPDEGTWTLEGRATAGGAVQAEHVGRGANKQPYVTKLTGTWSEQAASGTYVTPRCSYSVQLERR